MSELKLCPYRPFVDVEPGYVYVPIGNPQSFGPCLQDKCAMFREDIVMKNFVETPGGKEFDNVLVGFCGLAGRP
jgi:hypothetical protein